eukprot:TRINITY_DN33935_c0_g1_i1.p1 TRINITY_DN33935_c0_g1~~TRINITY_DN33935_c0_g1_i1.p1  ORF type:complete len:299 (-),score=28.49 TRINITY_DN33935_c0_g1_i1:196-1092(-)
MYHAIVWSDLHPIVFANSLSCCASLWLACELLARRLRLAPTNRLERQLYHLALADVGAHLMTLALCLYYKSQHHKAETNDDLDQMVCISLRWIRSVFQLTSGVVEALIALGFAGYAFRLTGTSLSRILRNTWKTWILAVLLSTIVRICDVYEYAQVIELDWCRPIPQNSVLRVVRFSVIAITLGTYLLTAITCFTMGGRKYCRRACLNLSTYPAIILLTYGPVVFISANDLSFETWRVKTTYTMLGINGFLNAVVYKMQLRHSSLCSFDTCERTPVSDSDDYDESDDIGTSGEEEDIE